MDHVDKVMYFDEIQLKVEDTEVAAYITEDYSKKETRLVYEGRYPKNEKEITLAGILAERLNKKVGDTVTVSYGDESMTFNVVGLSNGSQMGGLNTSILTEDFEELNPEFKPQSLYIYLEEGTSASKFIKTLEKNIDKNILLASVNFDKEMEEGMASYQKIVAIMGLAMLIITFLVVMLVLYFIISSSVIRIKRDLGIQKAIGFTTLQLMKQLSISFTIPIWIIAFGAVTIILSYCLSMLITWRIKKISAYALVTE